MYKHILAATDFSDLGDHALVKATELAIAIGAKLTFVHVRVSEDSATPMYAEHEVREYVEKLEARVPVHAKHIKVDFQVRVGDASTEILAAVIERDADLLVLASNGQKGFTRWLVGSTTDKVVRGIERDVLVINGATAPAISPGS